MLEGGVEGGKTLALAPGLAGEGEVARYRSRSAPSSPVALPFRCRNDRDFVGGGVRGGEELNFEECILKVCRGSRWLSSSDVLPKEGESGMVGTSDAKDRLAW